MFTVRTLRAVGLLALLALGSGCSLYLPRPVTFRVRDGDTGQPVAGAKVEAKYSVMMDFGTLVASVGPRQGVTDGSGDLALVLDPRHRAFRTRVFTDDYPEDDSHSTWFGSPRWEHHMPGARGALGDEYLIHLFRGPKPTADVTVPDGYRGVVVVRFEGCDRPPPALRGRREFTYTATAGRVVDIPEGGLFENFASYEGIRVRYGNGPTLPTFGPSPSRSLPPPGTTPPADPADATVALRFITPDWERHIWLYVLGTAAEAEAVLRTVWPDGDHFDEAAFKRVVGTR